MLKCSGQIIELPGGGTMTIARAEAWKWTAPASITGTGTDVEEWRVLAFLILDDVPTSDEADEADDAFEELHGRILSRLCALLAIPAPRPRINLMCRSWVDEPDLRLFPPSRPTMGFLSCEGGRMV